MRTVKITRRDSDVRPCSRGYDRCADGEFRRSGDTTGTTNYGARAVQKCQLSGIVPPRCRPVIGTGVRKRKQSIASKIRTPNTTGLRKQHKNRSQRNQPLRARIRSSDASHGSMRDTDVDLSADAIADPRCSLAHVIRQTAITAHKKRRPFASGPGLRGGRWPGPQVERDGLSCYCGRGWVSDWSHNSMAAATSLGGIAATGVVSLTSHTRPASDRFTRAQKSFLMAIFCGSNHRPREAPMTTSPKIERALISVSDKTGLTEFAQALVAAGVEIFASGGSRKHLEAGRHPRPRGGRLHRLPRNDGWPDQNAASQNPRRHPLPPRPPRRHGRHRRAGHRAVRAGGREPVPVRGDGCPARTSPSKKRSRTSTSAARR